MQLRGCRFGGRVSFYHSFEIKLEVYPHRYERQKRA